MDEKVICFYNRKPYEPFYGIVETCKDDDKDMAYNKGFIDGLKASSNEKYLYAFVFGFVTAFIFLKAIGG